MKNVIKVPSSSLKLSSSSQSPFIRVALTSSSFFPPHGAVIFITFNDIKMMEYIFPEMNEKDKLGQDSLRGRDKET